MKQHALAVFHRPPERLNCAQAVLAAYQAVTGRTVAPLSDFEGLGSGRAPEGECGALHAACRIAPASAPALQREFLHRAGATQCRDLKRRLRVPCTDCVALAAELLQQHTASTDSHYA